ncbi:MAG: hypothetical protein WC455_20210 [Dehalococcoidia bacterium]|jgi:hypothetical protein
MSEQHGAATEGGGELGTPTQQPSPAQAAQTSPVDAKSLAEALKSDNDFLDAVANRVRSVHDKRTVNHEKRIFDVEGALARVNELMTTENWTQQQAIRIMKLEEAGLAPAPEPVTQPSPANVAGPAPQTTSVSDLTVENYAKFLEVDPTSAEYLDLVRTSPDKPTLLQKITDISERRKQAASTASAAAVMQSSPGSATPQTKDAAALTTRLAELDATPMLTKQQRDERTTIKAELIKLVPKK